MYNPQKQSWQFASQYTPFMYALNFLHEGQAKESMRKLWAWDPLEMGVGEPDWKNYFGWDSPGGTYCEGGLSVVYSTRSRERIPGCY